MESYSIAAAAEALAKEIRLLSNPALRELALA
jgi:hypothetical protein